MKQARVVGWQDVGGREAALIQRCAEGDEAACTQLVAEHQRFVVELARTLLSGNRHEALDVSQEVFLRVFRTIHRFRGNSSLRTWIYRITINLVRNRHRDWKRAYRDKQVTLDQLFLRRRLPASLDTHPEHLLAQKEVASQVEDAINLLPFDERTAIILRERNGLSYDEIAYTTNVTTKVVKVRLQRARNELRETLRGVVVP